MDILIIHGIVMDTVNIHIVINTINIFFITMITLKICVNAMDRVTILSIAMGIF